MIGKLNQFVRDVTKAFEMSKNKLRIPNYLYSPKDMQVEKSQMLNVTCPLYGMPELRIYCFNTDTDYHNQVPTMTPKSLDPYLLFRKGKNSIDGIVGIQVDETIFVATQPTPKKCKHHRKSFPV